MILIFFFSVSRVLPLYVFFEASLIPIFLIIFIWGYQPERFVASFYLIFYIVTSSLPLLAVLIITEELMGKGFHLIDKVEIPSVIVLVFLLAFLVKLPLFFTHI